MKPIRKFISDAQRRQFNDKVILVDLLDNKIGEATKLEAHLQPQTSPHRAFSVFAFTDDKFLLQRRSKEKITYPLLWTNTCCSHPIPQIEENGLEGIKKAATRRLKYEMGMTISEMMLIDKLVYRSTPKNNKYEEFEVDYVLICKATPHIINPTEIAETRLSSFDEIRIDLDENESSYTPWFIDVFNAKGKGIIDMLKFFQSVDKNKRNEFEESIKLRQSLL